jgi:CheY-like chemotaxis protein
VRVLVVDDDDAIRRLLVSLLRERLDCRTTEAADGLKALAAIKKAPPQAIVLDLDLPTLDGVEVLEALRSEPAYASIPVVVISGHGDAERVRKAIALGAADFLVKPFRIEDVERRLRRACDPLRHRPRPSGPAVVRLGSATGDHTRVLLVDRDMSFRQVFCGVLEGRAATIAVEHSTDGLRHYFEFQPHVVCLGEGLSLPNDRVLARKIRTVDDKRHTRLYRCGGGDTLAGEYAGLFDATFERSFAPARLRVEFARLLIDRESIFGPLRRLLLGDLAPEVVSAARDALRPAATGEVSVLPAHRASDIATDVGREVDLAVAGKDAVVRPAFAGSRADVEQLAGSADAGTPAGTDALDAIIERVATRLAASFDARGVRVAVGAPHPFAGTHPSTAEVVHAFELGDRRLLLTVSFAIKSEPHA